MNAPEPTRREAEAPGGGQSGPTRREPASAADGQSPTGGGLLSLQGDLADRFALLGELPARGSEADLFLVRGRDDHEVRVLKLYRTGIEPKAAIAETLARLDRRHVIGWIEDGEMLGRSYEILEYAAGGSLRRTLQQFLSPAQSDGLLQELVPQMTAIIAYLHGLEPRITHRDVKPDNILVRRQEPLEIVVTDFGISSLSDFTMHMTRTAGTPRYMAPEALGAEISPAVDWWSLGMVIMEIASGEPPFSGLTETQILVALGSRRRIDMAGVERRLPHWAGLIAGLLQHDPALRWSGSQVRAWLDGDAETRLLGRRLLLAEPASEIKEAVAERPYRIDTHDCLTARELAIGLARNWAEAIKGVARGLVEDWLRRRLGDQNLINRFQDILDERTGDLPAPLPPEQQLLLLLRALLPDAIPIADRDRVLEPEVVKTCLQASVGVADAQGRMAQMLLAGKMLTPDEGLARQLAAAAAAAAQGDPLGVAVLGDITIFETALQAAAAGDVAGHVSLGRCYDDGVGTPADRLKAELCYRAAAEGGVASAQFVLGERAFIRGDYAEAEGWLDRAAQLDHAGAAALLGRICFEGLDRDPDHARAAALFRLAADRGHAVAQANLSHLLASGLGVPRNPEVAWRWAQLSADADCPEGCYRAAQCHRNGWGTPVDDAAAFALFGRAGEAGHAGAQYEMGCACEEGRGTERDMIAAANWHFKAAQQGVAASQYRHGHYWHHGGDVSWRRDLVEAIFWYERAAANGYAEAICVLGGLHRDEDGVPKDLAKALDLFRDAANVHGHAEAQYQLGRMIDTANGTPRDDAESARLFLLAAEQGHVKAAYEYARACEYGWGIDADIDAAAHWYRRAAEAGDAEAQMAYGRFHADGLSVGQDGVEAVHWYLKAAAQDHATACFRLGQICRDGDEAHYQAAASWFQKAANLGHTEAECELGVLYRDGKGVDEDPVNAARLFRKAAEAGSAPAQYCWAESLMHGRGVQQNQAKALGFYEAAARQGNLAAMIEVGYAYEKGQGTAVNMQKAIGFYEQAVSHGSGWAMTQLGVCYEDAVGVSYDPAKAVAYFKQAVAVGSVYGHFGLGRMLRDGTGIAQDSASALDHFRQAAEADIAPAQFEVGLAYLEGRAVPVDAKTAATWFERAAEAGNTRAQLEFGRLLRTGVGVARDSAAAVVWLRKAAEANNAEAQAELAEAIRHDTGVAVDKAEALQWAERSAASGNAKGVRMLAEFNEVGFGKSLNLIEAIKLYQRAADLGDEPSRSKIALLTKLREFGRDTGVVKLIDAVRPWFGKR